MLRCSRGRIRAREEGVVLRLVLVERGGDAGDLAGGLGHPVGQLLGIAGQPHDAAEIACHCVGAMRRDAGGMWTGAGVPRGSCDNALVLCDAHERALPSWLAFN